MEILFFKLIFRFRLFKLFLKRILKKISNIIRLKIIKIIFIISIFLKKHYTKFYYILKSIKFLNNFIQKLVSIETINFNYNELENNFKKYSIKSKKKIIHIDITSLTNGTPRTRRKRNSRTSSIFINVA